MAGTLIAGDLKIDQVRSRLLAAKAEAADAVELASHVLPEQSGSVQASWDNAFSKIGGKH